MTKYLAIATGLIIVAFIAYFHYAQGVIQKKTKENTALTVQVEQHEDTIKQLEVDTQKIKDINRELTDIERDSTKTFKDVEQNLEKTLQVKELKVQEKLIRQNTLYRKRCVELATGATPEEDEVNPLCTHYLQ